MKLISCYVENYGAICRKEYKFDKNPTCFLSDNGTGKTTLASFIKAMFYGLSSYKTNSKTFDDRQRFYPFSGGKFGGNLTFSLGEDVYRIERFFDKKSSVRDELTVYKNAKLYGEFGENIGKAVFGLDEGAFVRTAFLTADEVEITADGDLGAKLGRSVSDGDGNNLALALKTLSERRKDIKADRGRGGLIDREKDLRQTLSDEIADLREIENGLSAKYEERAALEAEISELNKKLNAANEARLAEEKWATYDRYESDLKEKRERIAELENLPSLEILQDLEDKCAEVRKNAGVLEALSGSNRKNGHSTGSNRTKSYFIAAIIAAALAIGGVCVCYVSLIACVALIAAGIIILAADGFLYLKNRMDRAQTGNITGSTRIYEEHIARLNNEIAAVLKECNTPLNGDIRGSIDELIRKRRLLDMLLSEERALFARAEKYKADNGLFERDTSFEQAGDVSVKLENARKRLGLLDRLIAEDEERVERLPQKLNEREEADGRIERLKDRYELITLTEKFLCGADGNLKEKYVAPVKERFDFYAEKISAVLGGKMRIDENFSLTFESGGEIRSGKHLSAGQRCVCGLCLRLALIDGMYGKEKPFLIMDDPFVNLDGENFKGVSKVLIALSGQAQIIYFTCHKSREI